MTRSALKLLGLCLLCLVVMAPSCTIGSIPGGRGDFKPCSIGFRDSTKVHTTSVGLRGSYANSTAGACSTAPNTPTATTVEVSFGTTSAVVEGTTIVIENGSPASAGSMCALYVIGQPNNFFRGRLQCNWKTTGPKGGAVSHGFAPILTWTVNVY